MYTQNNLNGNFSEDLTAQSNHLNYAFSGQKIPETFTALAGLIQLAFQMASRPGASPRTRTATLSPPAPYISRRRRPDQRLQFRAFKSVKNTSHCRTRGVSPNTTSSIRLRHHTEANQDIARMDYAISSKNQLTLIGVYNRSSAPETLPFTGGTLPGFGDVSTS